MISNSHRAIIILAIGLTPTQALAYLDPGLGGIIVQGIIGALVGVSVFWKKIKQGLSRLINRQKQPPTKN